MAEVDVPRPVRLAALLSVLMAPVGLLLVLDGLLELHWWGAPATNRLMAILTDIQAARGLAPPSLLRGRFGAVALVVIGVACLLYAALAPLIRTGRQWARTAGLLLCIGTFLVGLAGIGFDLSGSDSLEDYFGKLIELDLDGRIPEITALLYPAWYMWVEDVAQGLQVLVSLAAGVALVRAVLWHGDYFVSKKAEAAAPDDAWDAFISRQRQGDADTPPSE